MFTRSFLFLLSLLLVIATGAMGKILSPQEIYARYTASASDSERIVHLGKLAAHYYAIREDAVADSIFEKQLMLAEDTRNKAWIAKTLFENPRFELLGTITRTNKNIVTIDASAKTLAYINRAMSYAKAMRSDEYVALGYRLLSVFYLGQGEFEQAFKNANQSYTTALNTKNDSVKVVCGLQLGATYLQQRDVLMAFKTYSNAFDIANELHHPKLLSQVYLYFSDLYRKVGKIETAIDYVYKSRELNEQSKDTAGLVDDHLALGKLMDHEKVDILLKAAEGFAHSIGNIFGELEAQRLLFVSKMFENNPQTPLQYLATHPLLKDAITKTGKNFIDWTLADVYMYGGQPDSAYSYFRNAEFSFSEHYNIDSKQKFVGEFAACCGLIGHTTEAITYYEKGIELCNSTLNIPFLMDYLRNLRELYKNAGNFERAYQYSIQYEQYKDSLNRFAKEEDLALMEIENLNKKRAKEVELAQAEELRRHNLQYMIITLSIAAIFVLLIFLGLFPFSKLMIKIMGFFAFILFFEFIILLADHKIHHMMHGEPLKIWLVKIVLLSGLLPLHHFIEEKAVHFLSSKKLALWREKFSIKNWFREMVKELDEQEEKEAEAKLQPPE